MKLPLLAAASGLALSAFLIAAPANGQGRVDAQGRPTTDSTPAEKAETAALNNQISAANAAADAQANANNARYQQQQQNYQNRLQKNQAAQQSYQNAKQNYENEIANYDAIRERYARERAAYVRGVWPDRYARLVIVDADPLIGERVQLITGARVGTVVDADVNAAGRVAALLVRLDTGKLVWIDSGDVRYHRADGVVMTNLDRRDLIHMADQRL
ncbi:MAG: PRC-barrel domain-containing protein [Verrucomicrobia bacterium]|nr:PRC-barrel domain-containing protein [Verrucomicrobiota bacterium]